MTATKFSINGRSYTVNLTSLPADISLNTFIREHAGLPATKFMCQEGGCGVCICVVSGKHPVSGVERTWAVNSCLTLLNSCTDLEILTSEGLGSKRIGYHAIQKRLAMLNGTQCGYCSPGIVMNMYGLLAANDGKLTMAEVENAFGGNLCRCTGYRPILDAMKSFATDSNIELPPGCQDIEDLNLKMCPKTGQTCNNTCHAPSNGVDRRMPVAYADGSQWFWPKTLADIFAIFDEMPTAADYILVAGNTAHGVYRSKQRVRHYIDVNAVPELHQHSLIDNDRLILGANLSLTEAMEIFKEAAAKPGFEYCAQLWQHFDLIANVPVRNAGTLGGNLSIKHQHKEFPSDVFIVFEALDVQVLVNESATSQKTLSLAEYLDTPMQRRVVQAFVLKAYPREQYIFDSYKIMPRAQNAHAYVNAAFLLQLERPKHKVQSARICFGGIHSDFAHATSVESFLIGKKLFEHDVINAVFAHLQVELAVADAVIPDASPAYRQKLASGLLYKFLLAHAPAGTVPVHFASGSEILKRDLSSGKQSYETFARNYPVTKPTVKLEGLIQTAGEASYANDLPVQSQQVWAAFVTAKKVGATVIDMDASPALQIPGVVAFLSAKDIPGRNSVSGDNSFFFPVHEELFATGSIKFYNQPIGLILAESNSLANHAAELVKLTYAGGSAEVLPTLNDVLNSASAERVQHTIKSLIKDLPSTESCEYKGSGKLEMGLQYHFYMEPQTTIAVPLEGCLQINVATQWMDLVQTVIANLLKLPNNEVQVKTRRLGGGYGGKAKCCVPAACAAALAAYKLNRPVRFVQSLESMMNTLGKRWALYAEYDFYARNNGKIVALRTVFNEDAGYMPSESPMNLARMLSKNCYELNDNYKLDGYMIFTDSPSNSPCRAPGSVEGISMMENIIEHIAFESGLDPVDVRLANLNPGHKMAMMLPRFIRTTEYKQRRAEVFEFNGRNRWRKRGLGLSLIEYRIDYFGQYGATVVIYHGDGTVVISHGGIEMGQGMNTKITQVVAHTLEIPLELIRVEASNTINGANSMVTGGSIGSESLCFAIRKCCQTLNERLEPVKAELKGSDWQEVIDEAHNRKINLVVSDYCKEGDMDPYTICGLGLTEVEVDILTGNYLLKRVDILEDTGESLNPNVDVGQIEGAFIMGLGYWTTELFVVDKTNGELKTNRTWNYKPPGAKDIPIDFRIEMLPQSSNTGGFMRSKATGEPAICLAVGVTFALQQALQSARDDAGLKKAWVTLSAPMTPEHIVLNAGTDVGMFKLS